MINNVTEYTPTFEANEKVLWRGRPGATAASFTEFLISVAIATYFLIVAVRISIREEHPYMALIILYIFLLALGIFKTHHKMKMTHYFITTHRVIICRRRMKLRFWSDVPYKEKISARAHEGISLMLVHRHRNNLMSVIFYFHVNPSEGSGKISYASIIQFMMLSSDEDDFELLAFIGAKPADGLQTALEIVALKKF